MPEARSLKPVPESPLGLVASIFRNLLGKPGASDFRDSADHFVAVMREHGVALSWEKDELRSVDALAERLASHNEYPDAVGSYLAHLLLPTFPPPPRLPAPPPRPPAPANP